MHAVSLAVVVFAAAAVPDLLMPGRKAVRHEIEFIWDADTVLPRFALSPLRSLHGHAVVRPGQRLRFSSKYGSRLWIVPTGAELPDASESLRDSGWTSLPLPVRELHSIGVGHPLAQVVTTIRIAPAADGGFVLAVAGERYFDSDGHDLGAWTWMPLVVLSLLGAVWVWVLDRRASRPVAAP